METSQASRFITPTLQSNFNYAINTVLQRMNTMGIWDTWKAIETLYLILPPDIHTQVKEEYEDIIKRINEANDGTGISYIDMVEANDEVNLLLDEKAKPFFRKMYAFLYEGGYLEKKSRKIDTNITPDLFAQ